MSNLLKFIKLAIKSDTNTKIQFINSKINVFFVRRKGVEIEGKIEVYGKPLIVNSQGKIKIKNGVSLVSFVHWYHSSLNRVKLYTSKADAYIEIGENSELYGTTIHAKDKIIIGKNVLIAGNCIIIDSNGHNTCWDNPALRSTSKDIPQPIIIKDNVWICLNSIILKGTIIGEGTIIGANSVVKGNIPPFSLVMGNPAKIVATHANRS
jgi:acetyltransferase-like isoleucine patch superfamily enzyme